MTDRRWTHRVVGGPWFDRRGLRCRVLTPFDTPGYPANRSPWADLDDQRSVIVLIENDPLGGEDCEFCAEASAERGWSCVIDRADIAPLDDTDD